MLAVAIAYENQHESWVKPLTASLIFGLAIVTKYIPIYFGAAFIVIAFSKRGLEKRPVKLIRRDIAFYTFVPGMFLFAYIWWLYAKYSVFISYGLGPGKPNFFDVPKFLRTFSKYLVFLGICCGPLPLFIIFKNFKDKKRQSFSVVLIFVALFLGLYISGIQVDEMDFGGGFPFGISLFRGIQTIGFGFGLSVLLIFLKDVRSTERLQRILFFGVTPSLVMISFTLPTQRYIMLAIPAALILLVEASNVLSAKLRNFTLGLTVLGFAAVSLLGMSYLRAQGNASENMAVWMEQNLVIDQSSASPISMHAGQHFYGITSSEFKYEVIQTSLEGEKLIKERILHREAMNVLGKITRVYVLRELTKIP
jgi:hypothetical protein